MVVRPRDRPDTDPAEPAFGAWGHDPHTHPFDQFLTSLAGTATVRVGDRVFPLSSAAGLWIPAGVEHSARFDPGFAPFVHAGRPGAAGAGISGPFPLSVATELRHRLLRAELTDDCVSAMLGEALTTARLADSGTAPLLRLARTELTDPIAVEVAELLRRNPDDSRSVEEFAAALHTSSATIRRAFRRETGANFSQWRTAVRLEISLEMLRRGDPVSQVARAVGLSHNGLIVTYRRWLGCSPSAARSTGS